MTSRPHRPAVRYLFAALLAGLVISGSACAETNSTRTLVVREDPPAVETFTLTPSGAPETPPGSLRVFNAPLTTDEGITGTLIGTGVRAGFTDSQSGEQIEERLGTLVFHLGGDQLVVVGGATYPLAEAEMQFDIPQVRAVTGGTGTYLGARGQVTSVRNADGTYTHTFELTD